MLFFFCVFTLQHDSWSTSFAVQAGRDVPLYFYRDVLIVPPSNISSRNDGVKAPPLRAPSGVALHCTLAKWTARDNDALPLPQNK